MREIEFRGKRKIDNTWIYGGYMKTARTNKIQVGGTSRFCTVYPETLGEYTGRKDKNGTKIYEGDVLEFCFDDIGNQKAIIIYNNTYTSFMLRPLANFCFTTMSDGVVVGNIHDNPELLGEKDVKD